MAGKDGGAVAGERRVRAAGGAERTGVFDPYVPRVLLRHLAAAGDQAVRTVEGTMLFSDLSGFTRLSERLQRRGREGAELLTAAINDCFDELLTVARLLGGSMVKFGGDSLLVFFPGPGHASRACGAATGMRAALRQLRPLGPGVPDVKLRMTVGLHSGDYQFFLVGASHREHMVVGPAASTVVRMENAAQSGQIVVSPDTARLIPAGCLGGAAGPGHRLRRSPVGIEGVADDDIEAPPDALVASTLSTAVRAHVTAGRPPAEHRTVTVAFLHFEGTDGLVADHGVATAAAALDELVTAVQAAADQWQVCFLGSDVDADGGKIILVSGAPRVVGDDEERMLLALRTVLDAGCRLPLSVGVNRGPAFTGEIGPAFRRTYQVMGDTVNLAARLTARAPAGRLYATAEVLVRSATRFSLDALEPFPVKGKTRPVRAWNVGAAGGGTAPGDGLGSARERHVGVALVGRRRESAALSEALASAREGRGRLVEVVGDAGIGKTRLIEEVLGDASGMRIIAAAGEAYRSAIPYALWHSILRQVMGLEEDADPETVVAVLHARVNAAHPMLAPWVPLLAGAAGVTVPSTPEVDALAPGFRRARLHQAVLRFLEPALSEPTVLSVESAHHLDEASSALLLAVTGSLALSSWLVLVTRRTASPWFRAPAAGHVLTLEPGPLTPVDAEALAEAATEATPLPPHMVSLAVDRSGGNPQFLLDLLAAARSGLDELPDSATAAALAQIDALGPIERAVVRRASVLGMSFNARDFEAVSDRGSVIGPETWSMLDGVFEVRRGEIRFRSTAVREAAYSGLPFSLRRQLHGAVATSLEIDAAGGRPVDPGLLSLHFLLGRRPGRAFPLAVTAAEAAAAQAAPADAARLYRRALESGRLVDAPSAELADIFEALAEMLRRAGEPPAADAAFREARHLTPGDPVRGARTFCRQASLAGRSGHMSACIRWAGKGIRALAAVEGDEASAWRARLLMAMASSRLSQGRASEALSLCHQAIAEAERVGGELAPERATGVAARALAHAGFILDSALVQLGREPEAVHSARSLAMYDSLGEVEDKSNVLNNLGMFAYWAGRWDEAMRLYREAAEHCERVGDVSGAAYGDCNVGEVLSDQGQYEEAAARLGRCLQRWRSTGDDEGVAFAQMFLGRLAVRRGNPGEGRELLAAAAADFRQMKLGADARLAEAYGAEAAVYGGARQDALAVVDRLATESQPRLAPLLERLRAFALVPHDPVAAAGALEASLAAARRERCDYDVVAALDALIRLTLEPDPTWEVERRDLCARLGIVAVPPPPTG